MTELRYPELVAGEDIPKRSCSASEDGALLVRNPSPALPGARSTSAWCCSPAQSVPCPASSRNC
ncbi:hypothetical protein P4123_08805 [Pseudomonas aeruginosa]|nr:hypothetical protein [Pseudomonas aeruginosa]